MVTVVSEQNPREIEQSFTLHSGELITITDDSMGVEITGAVEPEGLHLVCSVGDVAELVIRLTDILHRRLPSLSTNK